MIVIFDLDGTIANIDHRRHLVENRQATNEDWRTFFAACVDDEPNFPVITVLKCLFAYGFSIYIFSGRSDEVRSQTKVWLKSMRFITTHCLCVKQATFLRMRN
jgi:hypothetical protein